MVTKPTTNHSVNTAILKRDVKRGCSHPDSTIHVAALLVSKAKLPKGNVCLYENVCPCCKGITEPATAAGNVQQVLTRVPGTMRATEVMSRMAGEQEFYQLYFQEPGKAEAEFEADVRKSILAFLYSASGDPPPEQRWRFLFGKHEKLMDTVTVPDTLPDWLTEADLDFFTKEFEQSGFRGGLNWYRNIDQMSEFTPFLIGAKIQQPTLFVAGEIDAVVLMYGEQIKTLEQNIPNLKKKVMIPGAGHWIQQERPNEVNALLIEFLKGL